MPETQDGGIRGRSFWSGTISFGLVSVPVNLFPANRSGGVSLRMLDRDGTPLARRYFDPETGREVPTDRLVRGYEIAPDQHIVITDEELESLEPEKSRDIDLRRFVDRDQVPPILFERAYYLTPAGQSTKAYRLLAATMERTGQAGIATFVMRTREYLVAILAEGGILRAETLRFQDEIRPIEDVGLPDVPGLDGGRVREIREAIASLTEESLDLDELSDEFAQRLRALVDRKRRKGVDVVAAPAGTVVDDEDGDVIDLMEVLKRSLRPPEPGPRRETSHARGGDPGADLQERSKTDLYEEAKARGIPGRSGMTKAELIRALRRSA